ncbi:hypothetical protein TU84_22565 [Pseudomonas helleri]|nr:hypothetical protein TU84_22565 [Pseudomonas helleri]
MPRDLLIVKKIARRKGLTLVIPRATTVIAVIVMPSMVREKYAPAHGQDEQQRNQPNDTT